MTFHKFLSALILTAVASLSVAADNILSIRDTITDPYIVYPESYEADVHKMRLNWYLQNYVALDKNVDSSVDVNTTKEQYIERLKAIPTKVEMPYNEIVRGAIERYTGRHRGLVENMLGMSTYYMPIFEEALEKEGVPLELKYLPIVESALNPEATSRAKAAGLWQFIVSTGRDMQLEINSLVDERRDPIKSSEAAAKYLRQLYDIYGDWSLAISAYNCGPGNVNKALRRAGEGKKDFWEIYAYLPTETKGYFPTFIAATYVMNYYDKHGISPALARRPILTDTVHVNHRVHFRQISDVLDIPVEALRTLNPQYREDIIPGNVHPYVLILPSHQALSYIMSEDSIIAHNASLYNPRGEVAVGSSESAGKVSSDGKYKYVERSVTYKVKRGDTYAGIASKYGVSVATVKKANRNRKTLKRGQRLTFTITEKVPIPVEEQTAEAQSSEEQTETGIDDANAGQSFGVEGSETGFDGTVVDKGSSEDNIVLLSSDAQVIVSSDADATPQASDATSDAGENDAPGGSDSSGTSNYQADSASPAAGSTDIESVAPAEETPKETPKKETKKKEKAKDKKQYHKVRSGENLSKIARRYGTTVNKLQKLNPSINPSQLRPGQSIRVK